MQQRLQDEYQREGRDAMSVIDDNSEMGMSDFEEEFLDASDQKMEDDFEFDLPL